MRAARLRTIAATLSAALLLALAGALLVAWSGIVDIGASTGHWPATRWFLTFGMRNSVAHHAADIAVPPLDDPGLVLLGAGHYQGVCAPCHGAPGRSRNPAALAMLPEPPELGRAARDWSAAELFWIVRHGLKYTGMPAWPAAGREDEVWAVVAFLRRLPTLDAAAYRALALGEAAALALADEEAPRLLALAGPLGGALAACARCHGLDGGGRGAGLVPRLAGLSAEYLHAALLAYAAGTRPSGIMQPVVADLGEAEMQALAAYYAGVPDLPPPPAPTVEDPALLQEGGGIARGGAPGVPACAACHGPGPGPRDPLYPALAGQHADYIAQQLRLWQQGVRGRAPEDAMATVAQAMTERQIRAVALYYATLRPDAPAQP